MMKMRAKYCCGWMVVCSRTFNKLLLHACVSNFHSTTLRMCVLGGKFEEFMSFIERNPRDSINCWKYLEFLKYGIYWCKIIIKWFLGNNLIFLYRYIVNK